MLTNVLELHDCEITITTVCIKYKLLLKDLKYICATNQGSIWCRGLTPGGKFVTPAGNFS